MSAIDLDIDGFFGEIASIRMDVQRYTEWCRAYEDFVYPKWTTKSGEKIALSDMSDTHLENTISLLYNKDPNNGWLIIMENEKKYRRIKKKLVNLRKKLSEMEDIADKIF